MGFTLLFVAVILILFAVFDSKCIRIRTPRTVLSKTMANSRLPVFISSFSVVRILVLSTCVVVFAVSCYFGVVVISSNTLKDFFIAAAITAGVLSKYL